ncbi:MAG: N-acetyltransferase [Phycisphaerales bacterium]|jgi:putative acetyltransferase
MAEPPAVTIRAETERDVDAIDRVLRAAFPTAGEAQLVEHLRADGDLRVSLVAELEGEVLGCVAISPVTIDGEPCNGVGLAPVAVLPSHQSRGIGATLVAAGLAACWNAAFCVVLGEPASYRRFGFRPAAKHGLSSTYDAGDAFMVVTLPGGSLPDGGGLVRYAPAFDALG